MTQPAPASEVVPTAQRPINGALSGLAAQLAGNLATGYLMTHGFDPGTATLVGTATGSSVSGTMATVGDWARGVLGRGVAAIHPLAQLPLMLLSRIG